MQRTPKNLLTRPRGRRRDGLRCALLAGLLLAAALPARAALVLLQAPGSPTLWLVEDSAVEATVLARLAGLVPGARAESLATADCPIVDGALLAQRIGYSRRVIALVDPPARAALLPLLEEQHATLLRDGLVAEAAAGPDLPELLSLRAALRAVAGEAGPPPALRLVVARLAP